MKTLKYPLDNHRSGPKLHESLRTTKTQGHTGGDYKTTHVTRVDGTKKPKGGSKYI